MNKIRTVTIARIGNHRTVKFAVEELRRYLKLMDRNTIVDVRLYDDYYEGYPNLLWVGMSQKFDSVLPNTENRELDDAIFMDVQDFRGIITGNNIRSVLFSVYRFLREIGAIFAHPGEEGEIIPHRSLDLCSAHVCEAPSNRYRVMCIEGAVSYEHIYNMIDWLPKVGMNGYQMQFMTPMVFLNRWHKHTYNASLGVEPLTREEAYTILKKAEEDIADRSLVYHGVGHGWTAEALGIPANGWAAVDANSIPAEARKLFALISGKRELFRGTPASTQLCYSNPKVLEIVSRTIADYCEGHPEVDYIDVWLADSSNNFCECENCAKLRPSDWYVELLNKIDELFTARDISTRIGVCAYNEVAWAPLVKRIKNPERFLICYAPITRPFTDSYDELDMNDLGDEPPYELNKLDRPREMRPLVNLLAGWQKTHPALEYCVFDYHLWFSPIGCDPGRFSIAKILLRDIKAFPTLGLKGLVSCQVQREGFPTNLPMAVMSQGLWNNKLDFDTICNRQLSWEFGEQWRVAREYLEVVSDLIAYWPHRLSEPDVIVDEKRLINARKAIEHIQKYKQMISEIAEGNFEFELQKRSWKDLLVHTEVADICARLAVEKFSGKTPDERKDVQLEYHHFFRNTELELHRTLDLSRQLMNTGAGAE